MPEVCDNTPSAECQLYIEKLIKPIVATLVEVTTTVEGLRENHERTAKTVHGENYDNGMVQAVNEATKAIEDLEKLPTEMRSLITKWGFFILGANGAASVVAITILVRLLGGD